MRYPRTKTVDASDTYFDKTYHDPYRWLESMADEEVEAWFKEQANLTDEVMAAIPGRDALLQEWIALDKRTPADYSDITYKLGRVFYKKTLGGENVGKLFFREGWEGIETLLFDPAEYKPGVATTMQGIVPSWNGRHVAIALSSGGAEYSELRVLDVERGTLLPDVSYPSLAVYGWTDDSSAFFYDAGDVTDIRAVEIQLNRKTKLHRLGTDCTTDLDVFGNQHLPELGLLPQEIAAAFIDESYPDYVLALASTAQNEMRIFYAPSSEIHNSRIDWKVLCERSDMLVRGLALHGEYVYSITHAAAPRYKVVRTSVKHPDWKNAETVVPEEKDTIQYIAKTKNYLFAVYSNGVFGRLVKCELSSGRLEDISLPAAGTVNVIFADSQSDRCLVSITSWTAPVTIYEYDAETDTFERSNFSSDIDYPGFENLVSEEVEVPSHDGTMVPLSIVYRKGIPLNGSNTCILDGYGAYGCSATPYFSLMHSVATRNVVLGFAHPRGGGEKGEDWYKAGHKITKPNTWKDFIACAEYLIQKGFTSSEKLAATGGSAGGICISRALTERPDLFYAVICNVGVANAMRMEFTANGPANTAEFGTVHNPEECEALFQMDGVQHVKTGVNYPAVMGVAGWNDPRVASWQPGKLVAAMQAASTSGKPVLMKVNYDNGHFNEDKVVTFMNFADQYAFLLWQTGHMDFKAGNDGNIN